MQCTDVLFFWAKTTWMWCSPLPNIGQPAAPYKNGETRMNKGLQADF